MKPQRKRRVPKDPTTPASKKTKDSQQSDAELRIVQTQPNCYKVISPPGNKEVSSEEVTPEKKFMPDLSESSDDSGIILKH